MQVANFHIISKKKKRTQKLNNIIPACLALLVFDKLPVPRTAACLTVPAIAIQVSH